MRYKIVATPAGDGSRYALYDRERDPGETKDASAPRSPTRCGWSAGSWRSSGSGSTARLARTRLLLEGQPGAEKLSPEACEKLKAMGYVQQGCS